MDKNTKILTPEISGDWTERLRFGGTNIWNNALHGKSHRNGIPEVRLDPSETGLYAELINGAWYWVSGCAKCNVSGVRWSYSVCDKDNVCRLCSTHRSKLTEMPWGHPDRFTCKPCQDALDAVAKAEALARFAESEYDEHDFCSMDEVGARTARRASILRPSTIATRTLSVIPAADCSDFELNMNRALRLRSSASALPPDRRQP